MKMLTLALILLSFSGLSQARSQNHNRHNDRSGHNNGYFWQDIKNRQHDQHSYIDNAIERGQLTRREIKQLKRERRHLAKKIKHFRRQNNLSHSNKISILKHLDDYSGQIQHLKHNDRYARRDNHNRQRYSSHNNHNYYKRNRYSNSGYSNHGYSSRNNHNYYRRNRHSNSGYGNHGYSSRNNHNYYGKNRHFSRANTFLSSGIYFRF